MHLEALTNNTKKAWEKCGFLQGYYLAGGTALAFQIGHRKSIDLNFFSATPIKKILLKTFEEKFGGIITPLVKTTEELTLNVGGVKITCLHYPFPLLEPTIPTGVIPLADIRDIAAMKAYTIGRRQSFKDYVDLYILLSQGAVKLKNIIADTQKVYGEAFNDRLFLEQLLYTDDLDDENIDWIGTPVSKNKMQKWFKELIEKEIGGSDTQN